jgi:hypothetical protein
LSLLYLLSSGFSSGSLAVKRQLLKSPLKCWKSFSKADAPASQAWDLRLSLVPRPQKGSDGITVEKNGMKLAKPNNL